MSQTRRRTSSNQELTLGFNPVSWGSRLGLESDRTAPSCKRLVASYTQRFRDDLAPESPSMSDLNEEMDVLRRAIDRISGIEYVPNGFAPESPAKDRQRAEFLMRKMTNDWSAPRMGTSYKIGVDPAVPEPRVGWYKRLAWNLVGVFVPYVGACELLGISWKTLVVCGLAVLIANLVGHLEGRSYRT